MKVLVADDDPVSRRMISRRLERKGYETFEACDGFEALDRLREPDGPRLAVLDWVMPGLDGIETCKQIRSEITSHYVYILLVTARSEQSDLLTGLEAGADDYLIKPFDFTELQARLQVGRRILLAEEQLHQAQRIEAMGLLTGGIAHDFNNIVMIINSYCEILLGSLSDPGTRSKVEQIHKAGQRAASLTHELLAFSRKQVISPSVFNMNSIISDLRPMLQRLVGEHITTEISSAPNLFPVQADASQIERVLFNLAANARDAMPYGGKLRVLTENAFLDQSSAAANLGSKPGCYVMLSVSDTGTGMTKEVRSRAFDPFFTTKPRGQGSGMGLASVYGIVKQNGGFIEVDSELGKGSSFRIFLPCSERADRGVSPEASVSPELKRGSVILVVEDEDAMRNAICSFLDCSGFQAIGVENGQEALAAYRSAQNPPSVVLTDVLMPGISGPELAREILLINPKANLIFMSGYTDGLLAQQMVSMERFRFLQKPFQLSELLGAIGEAYGDQGLPSPIR